MRQFLGLNDGLSLRGPGRIYPKGLKTIRVEMVELGGKIGVKVRGYINMGVVTFLTFYYRIGTKGLI